MQTRHDSAVATTSRRVPAGLRLPSSPTTSGILAFLDGEPVGWCAVEPRSAYTDLPWQRTKFTVRGEDPADQTVRAVTCLAHRAGYRRAAGRHAHRLRTQWPSAGP